MTQTPSLLQRADAVLSTGRYTEYLRLVEEYIAAAPDASIAAAAWPQHVNALRLCGHTDAAIEAGERYAAQARTGDLREVLAECLRVLALAEDLGAVPGRVERLLDEARSIAEDDGLTVCRTRVLRAAALHRMRRGRYEAAEPLIRDAREAAAATGQPLEVAWSTLLAARVARGLGRLDEADRMLVEVTGQFMAADHPYGRIQTHQMQASIALSRRDLARARTAVEAALEQARRIEAPHIIGLVHNEAGEVARLDGDRARAMAHYEKASSLLGRASADGLVPRCNLAILRLEVGEAPDGLEEDLAAARLAGRSDLEAIFHTIGLATAAQQHDARGFDDHLRHARHRIAETQLREPDVAALARRSARAWLDAEPPDPRRAVLATELARTQDVARDTALERALCTAGAPAPFGHWLASGRLGAGGMGVVLAGVDPDGRAAAIKVLRPRADQAPASGREFEDEMRAIAALDHPAIISVLGFGRASALAATLSDDCPEGGPWLALEQLPGPSLRPWAGRLPWSSIRQVLLDLLDALAHAHSRGVLHLDIKPDNILLLGEHPDAGTCLSDFGLALHGVRHRDQIAGTLGYMAPEQLAGTRLGPSTDLFALGASAWALVTGTAPFRHGSVSDFTEDLWRGPPRAWTPRVPVPPDLRSWLDAMLANDTDHRIASAAEAAARLRELSSELVLPTTVPAPPGHAPSACETLVPSASMFELDGARAPASEPFATLVPSASMFDLPAPGADDTREPAPASTREAPVRPVPPTWPPEPRVLPGPPDLVPLRRGPLIARPVVQAALWRAVRDVAETGRSQTVALVGPEGSGRRTLARALQEAVDALGLGDRVSITRDGPEAMLLPGSLQLLRCTTPPPGVPALELPRVEASALEAMLCNLTPLTPTLASRLATAADGSPGLARALLDRLVLRGDLYAGPHGLDAPADATTTLPSAQRRAARASLDALCATEADLDALRIAAALAATGAPVPLDVWEGAAGGLPAGLQARSEAAAVIETASGAVRFRRPDVAWALRTDKRARRAHARCADWLSSHGAHPAEVGRHRAEAGQWEAALEVLLTTPAAPRALVQEAVDRLGLGPDDPRRRRVEGAARR